MAPSQTDDADASESSRERPAFWSSADDANTRGASKRSQLLVVVTLLVAGLLVVGASAGGALAGPPAANSGGNDSATTVAFIADAGMSDGTRDVLNLIADEGTDVVVYSGDFDYQDDPTGWVDMIDAELGPDIPVLGVMGNHDVEHWAAYQRALSDRLNRSDEVKCSGDLGWESTCRTADLTVVQSGAGICAYDDPSKAGYLPERCADYDPADDEAYVGDQLDHAATTWSVCSWHLNDADYQVGDKSSLVSAALYDTCREGGAIIATGHDHAYARTYAMADFSTESVADTSPPYTVGNGSTFAVVSGAAGHSIYDTTDLVDAPYWAATHTSGAFGAFFCKLNPDGTGECYFKTVDGEVLDGPFEIHRAGANDSTAGTTVNETTTEAPTTESTTEAPTTDESTAPTSTNDSTTEKPTECADGAAP